jgi:hypothetical protein
MAEICKCRQAITMAFEEAALALGGVAAGYPIPDEAVWELSRALDLIHARACARFGRCEEGGAPAADAPDEEEHPAIVHLLRRLNERPAATGMCGGGCRGERS